MTQVNNLLCVSVSAFLLAGFIVSAALAQETQPGDPCNPGEAHLMRHAAGPENPGTGYMLVCDGSTWKSISEWNTSTGSSLFKVDYDPAACDGTKEGRLRYDSSGDSWEYCHSNSWTGLSSGGGPSVLNDLSDVNEPAPNNSECLIYDSGNSEWIAGTCLSSENDPQVGSLSWNKWCISNGSTINCTEDAPDTDSTNEIQNLSSVLSQGNDAGGTTITNLPAPAANSDAATKAYVDAGGGSGGGGGIVVWGTTSCPSGYSTAYSGKATSLFEASTNGTSMSDLICVSGGIPHNMGNSGPEWVDGGSTDPGPGGNIYRYEGTIPCALCYK